MVFLVTAEDVSVLGMFKEDVDPPSRPWNQRLQQAEPAGVVADFHTRGKEMKSMLKTHQWTQLWVGVGAGDR